MLRSHHFFGPKPKRFIKVRTFFFFSLSEFTLQPFLSKLMRECTVDKSQEIGEEVSRRTGEKKALYHLHCQNKQVRAQTQRGSIHRAQWQAPLLSKPKEKSIVCECDPSVPPPLHLSTLLSHHFYRTFNAFVRFHLFSVFHWPPSPWQ